MFDYHNYLKQPDALSFDEALALYQAIYGVLENPDADLHELWQEVITAALAYTKMRTEWNFWSSEEKAAKDPLRTSLHNTFIINLTAFHRFCGKLELDDSWLAKLGPVEQRKKWGDFAGYLVCMETIRGR